MLIKYHIVLMPQHERHSISIMDFNVINRKNYLDLIPEPSTIFSLRISLLTACEKD